MTSMRKERVYLDWRIVLEDATALRNIVEAVQPVTPRVSFKIVPDGAADGESTKSTKYLLLVDAADVAFVCCVSARLVLDHAEVWDSERSVFCVECKHVLSAISIPSCSHMPLTLEGNSEENKLVLNMCDTEQNCNTNETTVQLYNEDACVALDPMEFDLILEMEPNLLRELIKAARTAHADQLRIQVHRSKEAGRKVSVTTFTIKGDFMQMTRQMTHDVDVGEDGSLIVRAVADGSHRTKYNLDELEGIFNSAFPIEKIDAFVKTLSCKMIMARAKQGMPLMLHYSLNGTSDDSSYVRFLVAPNIEDAMEAA